MRRIQQIPRAGGFSEGFSKSSPEGPLTPRIRLPGRAASESLLQPCHQSAGRPGKGTSTLRLTYGWTKPTAVPDAAGAWGVAGATPPRAVDHGKSLSHRHQGIVGNRQRDTRDHHARCSTKGRLPTSRTSSASLSLASAALVGPSRGQTRPKILAAMREKLHSIHEHPALVGAKHRPQLPSLPPCRRLPPPSPISRGVDPCPLATQRGCQRCSSPPFAPQSAPLRMQ
jgi:hypothetical protein